MALVDRAELVRRAEELGHTDLIVAPTKSGRRFVVACSCGYGAPMPDGSGRPTVTRATFAEAVRALQDHLWKALEADRRRRRNGLDTPNAGVSRVASHHLAVPGGR